jgi:hypothetical protein
MSALEFCFWLALLATLGVAAVYADQFPRRKRHLDLREILAKRNRKRFRG